MKAYIHAISSYIPQNILSNQELNEKFPEWSVDKIAAKTGIMNRGIAKSDEFVSDMAVSAATKLINDNKIDKNSIDFLLLCTQSPDYFLPTTACIVQERLGLSTNIGALDFNLGCSGYVYGLSLAKGLIVSGSAKSVLLITSETYSKFINEGDKSNRTIFGDAAAATLITAEAGIFEIKDFVFGTDGSGAENLIVKYGAVKHKEEKGQDEFNEDGTFKSNPSNLYMNGSEIFMFTNRRIPILVNETLKKNNLTLDTISLVVMHQANQYMLEHLRKKIGIPEEKFFIHLENCGNTVSSTIPIALGECLNQKSFEADEKILIAGFGVGYSWASTVLKKV